MEYAASYSPEMLPTLLSLFAIVPTGQFVGSCVEYLIWIGAGVYLVWFWPKRVRRDILAGKISEDEGRAKLTKFKPWVRFMFIVYGVLRLVDAIYNQW
jgi:hypothetical protein